MSQKSNFNPHQQDALNGLRYIKSNYTQIFGRTTIAVLDAVYAIGVSNGWKSPIVITTHAKIGNHKECRSSPDTVSRHLKKLFELGCIEYEAGGLGKRCGSKIRIKSRDKLAEIKNIRPSNPPHIVAAEHLCDALNTEYPIFWPMVEGLSKRGAPKQQQFFHTGINGTDYGCVYPKKSLGSDKSDRVPILHDLCKPSAELQYADFISLNPSLVIPDLKEHNLLNRQLEPFTVYDIIAKWLGCDRQYAKRVWAKLVGGKKRVIDPTNPYNHFTLSHKHVLYHVVLALNAMRQKLFESKRPNTLHPPQVQTLLGRTCFIRNQSHRGKLMQYRYNGTGNDLINILLMDLIRMDREEVHLLLIHGDAIAVAVNKKSNFDLVEFMNSKSAELGLHAQATLKGGMIPIN
jgi:hypothetical protein